MMRGGRVRGHWGEEKEILHGKKPGGNRMFCGRQSLENRLRKVDRESFVVLFSAGVQNGGNLLKLGPGRVFRREPLLRARAGKIGTRFRFLATGPLHGPEDSAGPAGPTKKSPSSLFAPKKNARHCAKKRKFFTPMKCGLK